MARGHIQTRTTKDGKKRFRARIDLDNGAGPRKELQETFNSERQAEEWLDKHAREIRGGHFFEPARLTFRDFTVEWFEKFPKLRESPFKDSTIRSYYLIVERYLNPFFGNMVVASITSLVIERDFKVALPTLLSKRSSGAGTLKTQRNILMVLRTMLNTALQWGYLKTNPFDTRERLHVKLPKYDFSKSRGRALNREEIRKLLETCVEETLAVVSAALFSGMREGELFALKWSDIDWKKNQIFVQREVYWRTGKYWKGQGPTGFVFGPPKTAAGVRRIDINPRLRKTLLEHKLRGPANSLDLVFASETGTPLDPSNFLKRQFYPALQAAELEAIRFHDLRHTFGSVKIAQGENPKYVQVQMGHARIETTLNVYAHELEKANPAAAARTDAFIFGDPIEAEG